MLHHALKLAASGLSIFPCLPRSKLPAVKSWQTIASRSPEQITKWWGAGPEANIAIATGEASQVFVVDIDSSDGEQELAKLGALPATVEATTSRGRHVYFKMPRTPLRNTAGKIAPHIDTRGTGGFVLCPPSLHPTGARYKWSGARTIASAPDWLLSKLTEQTQRVTPPAEWSELFTADIPEGQRDHTITRMAGKLLRCYLNAADVHGIVQSINIARCKPPLPPEDIERIVESIAGRELKRRGHGR
jgi:Bifunctional DNA primase/polymerase, N-terminal/Primase C terminal 1 (PriCT-1)